MILIIFGLPGAGKTYAATLLKNTFGFHVYDGDTDLPHNMKYALENALPVTDEMRDQFFNNLLNSISTLSKKYKNLVISQTYIKEKYRIQVLEKFPNAQFILIETPSPLREKRLSERKTFPLKRDYAQKMVENFDPPSIKHVVLTNNTDGNDEITKQLKKLLET